VRTRPAAALLLAAALLSGPLLTGCAGTADQDRPAVPAGAQPEGPEGKEQDGTQPEGNEQNTTDPKGNDPGDTQPDATQPAGKELVAGSLSGTDLAWLQLMAPMNDRTLLLLDLVRDRAESRELRTFAERLDVTHRAELARMRGLLSAAGVPDTNPHEGHDMTGMVTDEELREVEKAGAAFDRTALAQLREHLAQSGLLSRAAMESGTDRDTTALAAELAGRRAGQLTELTRLGG
jgi:uncharacterized protein (DUF305 family)